MKNSSIQVRERPILFITEMVRANQEGTKNLTRRTQGLDRFNESPDDWEVQWVPDKQGKHWRFEYMPSGQAIQIRCPFGVEGDRLWVRETWAYLPMMHPIPHHKYFYKADGEGVLKGKERWKPSIHMPRVACRQLLEIVSIRLERLQEISEQEAVAEGAKFDSDSGYYFLGDSIMSSTARTAFHNLWESLTSYENWYLNPWVWVIEYKVLEKGALANG